jgi:hypothetical protein
MRQRLSQAINGRFPRLSWNIWSSRRTLAQVSVSEISPALVNVRNRLIASPAPKVASNSRLLLVVPSSDHVEIPWEPAQGNYSFELFETASDYMGRDSVHVIRIAPGEETAAYHDRILEYAHDHGITHVLSRIDIEANGGPDWSWDLFVRKLRKRSHLIYLPLTYDSAYPYVSMHLDRITRLYSRAIPIVLDRPIEGVIRPKRPAAGPLFLPLSDSSMDVINTALTGVEPSLDLTFIGNVAGYPYRARLLSDLEQAGITVDINPHGRSEGQLAGFIQYAEALRKSRITLNFTRCNGVPVTQLKTRMLEGALFGSVVAADSSLYADSYFARDSEYLFYESPSDLKRQIEPLLENLSALKEIQDRARAKAEMLRKTNFWLQADWALKANSLSVLRSAHESF